MIFIHFNAERADIAPVGRRTIFTTREPEPIVARQAAFRIPTTVATLHHIIPTFAIPPPPQTSTPTISQSPHGSGHSQDHERLMCNLPRMDRPHMGHALAASRQSHADL